MKLCVFPNDPISAYYKKGEIKPRYFNPQNLFDEIHIISFSDSDIEEEKVKIVAGNAKLKIHFVGKIPIRKRDEKLSDIIKIVKIINPDIIRAYNPLLEGWFAANCAKQLNIPLWISIHTAYDQKRKIALKSDFKKFLPLKYTEKYLESFSLKIADKITIVFRIIEPYVIKHCNKSPELLYNKINCKQFENASPISTLPSPLVISVGNLIKEKNHECLIHAMKNVDGFLLIIGKGPYQDRLKKIIEDENLQDKILLKESIPNSEIQNYYKSAKVFALAYDPELEGLPIPVMEAMASGLPVVIPHPKKGFSDGLEEIAVNTKREPESFRAAIKELLENEEYYNKVASKSKRKALDFDEEKIEKREMEIYKELIEKKDSN